VNLISDLIMMVVAAVAVAAAYRLNGFLDPLFAYTAGISLLFLPAGIKLLFVLIGRLSAVVGHGCLTLLLTPTKMGGLPLKL
jgi:divalent metal cation (Fe/Co/Zn/Cd) transporter